MYKVRKFRIYLNDLSSEYQDNLRETAKEDWLEVLYQEAKENQSKYPELTEDEILNELYDLMDKETMDYFRSQGKYEEMLKFEVENFAEEKAEDEINRTFFAQGEVGDE